MKKLFIFCFFLLVVNPAQVYSAPSKSMKDLYNPLVTKEQHKIQVLSHSVERLKTEIKKSSTHVQFLIAQLTTQESLIKDSKTIIDQYNRKVKDSQYSLSKSTKDLYNTVVTKEQHKIQVLSHSAERLKTEIKKSKEHVQFLNAQLATQESLIKDSKTTIDQYNRKLRALK